MFLKQSRPLPFQTNHKSNSLALKSFLGVCRKVPCKQSHLHSFQTSLRNSSQHSHRPCHRASCKRSPQHNFRHSPRTLHRGVQKSDPRFLLRCCTKSLLPLSLTYSPSPVQTQNRKSNLRASRVPPLRQNPRLLLKVHSHLPVTQKSNKSPRSQANHNPNRWNHQKRSYEGCLGTSHGSCVRVRPCVCLRELSLDRTACRTALFVSSRPLSRSQSLPSTRCSQTM